MDLAPLHKVRVSNLVTSNTQLHPASRPQASKTFSLRVLRVVSATVAVSRPMDKFTCGA